MKARARLNINITSQFVELLKLDEGSKNIKIELNINKKSITKSITFKKE